MEKVKKLLRKTDSLLGIKTDTVFGKTVFPIFKYSRYYRFRGKPRFVKIETTNFCNSKCLYCPNKNLKRKRGFMNNGLFKKIIDECVSWGIKEIHLCNFGEPLVDSKLPERIKQIKERCSAIKTVIYTNGGLLDGKTSRKIMASGIDEIYVSFDGYSKRHFEKYRRPMKYETVLENIESAIRTKKELGAKTKIIIQPTYDKNSTSAGELERFKNYWRNKADGVSIQKIHDWHGYINNRKFIHQNIICRDLFQYMTINWDGSVVPCCLDYEGEYVLGNANKQTIKEIWFGKKFTEFRRKLLKNMTSVKMCGQCRMRFCNFEYPYLSSVFW